MHDTAWLAILNTSISSLITGVVNFSEKKTKTKQCSNFSAQKWIKLHVNWLVLFSKDLLGSWLDIWPLLIPDTW